MIAQTLTRRVGQAAGPLVTSTTSSTEAYSLYLERLRGGKGLFSYEIGIIHAALDDPDQAFKWFRRAVQERSGWIAYVRVDPRLDSFRADSRFDRLFAEATAEAMQN